MNSMTTTDFKDVLQTWKTKLYDVSKRNRAIKLTRLTNKWAHDCVSFGETQSKHNENELIERILSGKKVTLVDGKGDFEKTNSKQRALTDFYRNMRNIQEETGVYDVYIGYPFVTGHLQDGTFIQAPLFLYPVTLLKNGMKWELEPSSDVKIKLNSSLFVTLERINGIPFFETMEEEVDGLRKEEIAKWIEWLDGHQYEVSYEDHEYLSFSEYTKDTEPKFEEPKLSLQKYAVLGCFMQGSSSIMSNYELLSKQEETGNLATFISPGEGTDFEEVGDWDQEEYEENREKKQKGNYLFPVDGSQELILEEIKNGKSMVVHGPPGTGKSQVICNIVTDALSEGKRVLVVSQKRAALTVIKQRLQDISSSIALVQDEKADRDSICQSMYQTLLSQESYHKEEELRQLQKQITTLEERFDSIANSLYEVRTNGYRAYDLYGLANPVEDLPNLSLKGSFFSSLTKKQIEKTGKQIQQYASYVEKYSDPNDIFTHRNSFATFTNAEQKTLLQTFQNVEEQMEMFHAKKQELSNVSIAHVLKHASLIKQTESWVKNDSPGLFQKISRWIWMARHKENVLGANGDIAALRSMYEMNEQIGEIEKTWRTIQSFFEKTSFDAYKKEHFETHRKEELQFQQRNIISHFDHWVTMDGLYASYEKETKQVIDSLLSSGYHTNTWKQHFEQLSYFHIINEIEGKCPALKEVSQQDFQKHREEFQSLLKQEKKLLTSELRHMLQERASLVPTSVTKVIKREAEKKRQKWSLRKIVSNFYNDGLFDIMPVWLATPETVCSLFPVESDLFDLIVFDEASQCTVESSIPVLYRSKQWVVAGDHKQLPPQRLFQSASDEDEDGEEEVESLLILAKKRLEEMMLQWHYRSKSEELIQFSNHAFYHGNMQIAPNVQPFQDPAAIQWHKVDGMWVNQSNEKEAEEVVLFIKDLWIQDINKSIGVITFNQKQQNKILDIIDKMAENDPEFGVLYQQNQEREMDKRLFVKNIENVQGDERDIILFSVGYAKNEEGKVYNNFGTLNREGGENRLNVAVSRAKERIVLVSSIDPGELSVSNSKHMGPRLLQSYLQYAKACHEQKQREVEHILKDINSYQNTRTGSHELHFDSPFEEEVYQKLKNYGYEVKTQIGLSGYRIDLGIVHPNDPTRFIMGVECDGAMYHSGRNARERDAYRQAFLEDRGWVIERIWSRNWWKNRNGEAERIHRKIQVLLQEAK